MAPGWKRDPSSLVQATAITGRLVAMRASSRASSASNAASTPYMPSKRPPVGWLSMWLPLSTGGAAASVPSRRTNRLPIGSVKTAKPRALAHAASWLRAAASSGDRAWRLTPPLGVPPSLAMSTCLCQRRSSLTALAPLMHPPSSARAIVGRPEMHNHLERNLIGYGPDTPDPQWPGEARIAVSFVLNYEEGGENTILNGDAGSEVRLTEVAGLTPVVGGRDLST